jgi:hypothetical protein
MINLKITILDVKFNVGDPNNEHGWNYYHFKTLQI